MDSKPHACGGSGIVNWCDQKLQIQRHWQFENHRIHRITIYTLPPWTDLVNITTERCFLWMQSKLIHISGGSTCRKSLKPCLGSPVVTRAWNSSRRAVSAPPWSRGDWINSRIWGRISLGRLAIHDLWVLEIEVNRFKVNWKSQYRVHNL